MFFLNFLVAIIGYSIVEQKPTEQKSQLGFIMKFFTYQYGVYNRGSCLSRFCGDLMSLLIHCGMISALIIGNEIHIVFQFLILEAIFYFSEFMMRIFPFSINYKYDVGKMILTYLLEVLLSQTPLFIEEENICLLLTLLVHSCLLVILVMRRIQQRKYSVLFKKAELCLQINLKEDLNATNNSSSENTTHHYIIKYANKIQLVAIGQPKSISPQMQGQQQDDFQKHPNDIISAGIFCSNVPETIKNIPNLTLNEMGLISPAQQNAKNGTCSDDKQLEAREKQLTISKSSMQSKFKSEDEPTARKKSVILGESPNFNASYPANNMVTNSNHLILNANNTSICHQTNTNVLPLPNTNNNLKSISQSVIQSNHQTTLNLNKLNHDDAKHLKQQNGNNNNNNNAENRTRAKSLDAESMMNIDILNTLELDLDKNTSFQVISFHEESQNILIKTDSALFFFSLPDFKKTKSILLDKNSSYLFHQTEPYCIQYHYNDSSNQFQFTKLDLSQPKITKEDMKYNSLTMNNPKYSTNDLLYYARFSSDCNSSKDILFISDGPDLITINTECFSMESYTSKLPAEDGERVQIQQMNKRQIAINPTNQTQLQKIIIDIPTNICCRKFNNLPINAQMLPIDNLQNQVILNNEKVNKYSCVYDNITGETMELPQSKSVSKAWSLNKFLYIIDQTNSLKVYKFKGSKFNLLPPGDNGVSCISIGFF